MNSTRNFVTAVLMTVVTTVLLGLVYPLAITGIAQVLFRDKANGQLIERNGAIVGSRIIGQGFAAPGYFRSAAVSHQRRRTTPRTPPARSSGQRTRSWSTR